MLSEKYNQNLVKSKCVKIDNFLSLAENKKIIESVIKLEAYFQKSTTSLDLNNSDFRKSKVLYLAPISKARISNRIQLVLPQVLATLGYQEFPIAQGELSPSPLSCNKTSRFYNLYGFGPGPPPKCGLPELNRLYPWLFGKSL